MAYIRKLINWILGLFSSESKTPELDSKIEEKRDRIKELEDEKNDEITDVDEALDEWK